MSVNNYTEASDLRNSRVLIRRDLREQYAKPEPDPDEVDRLIDLLHQTTRALVAIGAN